MPEPLLEAAERAETACDLERGLPERAAALADETILAIGVLDPAHASPKAVWNLLWLAGDLTDHVDLYRASALLTAVERLLTTRLPPSASAPAPLAEAIEMAFDFFFNREAPPLASARFSESLAVLGRLLALRHPLCRRAALHGLGHLREHARGHKERAAVDALLESVTDRELKPLARLAQSGQMV